MTLYELIKKYFFGSKNTIIINIAIFIFSLIFVTISKHTTINNQLVVSKLYISDFPPQLIDSFNSSIYDLQLTRYADTERLTDNLRQITLAWKRNDKETDLKRVSIIKERLSYILERYIVLSDIQIKRILNDYDNCLIYLYKDQAKLPRQALETELDIKYVKWFLNNLEKLIMLERKEEKKFYDVVSLFDLLYSTIFISIMFIILINFVRFQKNIL